MPNAKNTPQVSVRELFQAIEKQNEKLAEAIEKQNEKWSEMERRIILRLESIPVLQSQIETNKEEVERLRNRSDAIDIVVAIGAAILSAISGLLGTRQ